MLFLYKEKNIQIKNLDCLEESIGYKFKNRSLLENALVHKSFSSRVNINNERLELLGDNILNACITLHLLQNFKDSTEGEIVKIRSLIISSNGLSKIAIFLELYKYIVTDVKKLKRIDDKYDLLSCFVESIFGAIFLDCKNFLKVKKIAINLLQRCKKDIFNDTDFYDYKSFLQNKSHNLWKTTPTYILINTFHDSNTNLSTFEVALCINENSITTGIGNTRKKAEQNAAKNACKLFSFNIEDFYSKFL